MHNVPETGSHVTNKDNSKISALVTLMIMGRRDVPAQQKRANRGLAQENDFVTTTNAMALLSP